MRISDWSSDVCSSYLGERFLAGLDFGKVEDIVDDAKQVLTGFADVGGIGAILGIADRAHGLLLAHFRKADDGAQRCAQLVAHHGEECRLRPICAIGFVVLVAGGLGTTERLLTLDPTGRAFGMERECLGVMILVVEGSVKQKNNE